MSLYKNTLFWLIVPESVFADQAEQPLFFFFLLLFKFQLVTKQNAVVVFNLFCVVGNLVAWALHLLLFDVIILENPAEEAECRVS